MGFVVSQELEQNLSILAGSLSERERRKALLTLAQAGQGDGSRLLMELFRLTPWAPLKCQILRAIGKFGDLRTTEFLYRQALSEEDLTTSREAVLSLGQSPVPLAQEILLSLATTARYPFRREAVHALGGVPVLTVSRELLAFAAELQQRSQSLDPDHRILHTLLTVLADHGITAIEEDLVSLLEREASHSHESGLLHACLLAAGSVATPRVRQALEALDLEDKTLGASLRATALRLAEAESAFAMEDGIHALGEWGRTGDTSRSSPSRRLSLTLSRLGRFSPSELRELADLFGDELGDSARLWLESILLVRPEDASQTLSRAFHQDDELLLACVAKSVRQGLSSSEWAELLGSLQPQELAKLSLCIRDAVVLEQLLALAPKIREEKIFTALCNGLVAQTQMTSDAGVADRFLAVLTRVAVSSGRRLAITARAMRALGQVAFEGRVPSAQHDSVMSAVEEELGKVKLDSLKGSSLVHALGNAPSLSSLRVLEQTLCTTLAQDPTGPGVGLLLNTLITFPESLLSELKLEVAPETLLIADFEKAFLRLMGLGVDLGRSSAEAAKGLVWEALSSDSFSMLVLGLDASARLDDDTTRERVLKLASHDDATIRSLALERMCRSRASGLQNALVGLLAESFEGTPELLLRCIDSFEIEPLDPPLEFAHHLRGLCTGNEAAGLQASPFRDPVVRAEGLALAEQILSIGSALEESPAFVGEAGDIPVVDASLCRDLPGFPHYSDTLQSVLRNAELPFCYPDIFDETVDKSTAVIEYVKSIDLLLQERVGEPLFLGSRLEVLAKLRTRVARLGLHEPGGNNERFIEVLELGGIFTPELFPSIKLGRLVQSVLAGRFVTEQVRILDGLKGWAVFLALFARSFRFGGLELEAVLPVRPLPGQRVARLAWQLILLQEQRNTAAHRGTILRASELQELRKKSVSVLAALDEIFPVPGRRLRPATRSSGRGAA